MKKILILSVVSMLGTMSVEARPVASGLLEGTSCCTSKTVTDTCAGKSDFKCTELPNNGGCSFTCGGESWLVTYSSSSSVKPVLNKLVPVTEVSSSNKLNKLSK